ncbi:hypothetical protein [Sandaracinobacteroides saxicola]|uniref:Uncharacterized protein n=1 Tax=Sandaracinobacteroides saxicola TaxID=2759707 RepID=A0A7G5IFF9_9SPHN|nr:hypothetical protein [Sandaracinobacteroides saxicola]QMW22101.1 hypothetical protein H3309_12080 [Sandaracinobacteroides saxicola]
MRTLPLLLLLAACATTPAAPPPPARQAAPPPPPGMERLIGKPPETALTLLGTPRLDRREGPARILQFAGKACVLDLFYYPRPNTPVATYAAARDPAGTSMAPATCLALLAPR